MPCPKPVKKKSNLKGQMGFEIGFIIFAIFYIGFVGYAAASFPGASDYISGSISAPALPSQPNVLDYLGFAINSIWYFVIAFFSLNINIPILGLISLTITLTGLYIFIKVIRGS